MPLPENFYHLSAQIDDIGTADTKVFVVPDNGFLRKIETVINGAITTADDVVTVSRNGSALAPTLTITQVGSAAGDYDFVNFYQAVAKGDRITVANSGASTGPTKCGVTLTFSR